MKYVIKSYRKEFTGYHYYLWFSGFTNTGDTRWSSRYEDPTGKPLEFDSFHEARKMLNKVVADDIKNYRNGLWLNKIEEMK